MSLSCACPEHYPDWDQQDVSLGRQCVHILAVPMLFHMPLSYELYLKRQHYELQSLHLTERWPNLVLTRTGMFRGALIRLLENASSPSRRVHRLPADFQVRGKLHKGGIGTVRNSIRQIQMELLDSGKMPKELYLCHLTCPHCRDAHGGDKILLLRRWVESRLLAKKAGRASQCNR